MKFEVGDLLVRKYGNTYNGFSKGRPLRIIAIALTRKHYILKNIIGLEFQVFHADVEEDYELHPDYAKSKSFKEGMEKLLNEV